LKDFGIKTYPFAKLLANMIFAKYMLVNVFTHGSQITLKKFSFGEVNVFLNVNLAWAMKTPT
jgi:hypothetical protein